MVERCSHAVAGFANFGVRQTDDVKRRQPRPEVHLHGHLGPVDTRERAARYRGDGHASSPREQRGAVGRGLPGTLTLCARFELGDALLEVSAIRLRALEELCLNLAI